MGQARHSSEGDNDAGENDEGDYGMGTAVATDNRENEEEEAQPHQMSEVQSYNHAATDNNDGN